MCNVNFSPPLINFIFLFAHSVVCLVNTIYWFSEWTKMEKRPGYPLFLLKKNFFLLFSTLFLMSISSVQSLSRVQLFETPWTAAHQASMSITNSRSLLKLMSVDLVMPSNHLILCLPLLLLPSIFPSIRVFPNESVLPIRWPEYWSFSFSISPSNEYSGLISFRMDWLDLLTIQGTLKSLLQHYSSSINSLALSFLYSSALASIYDYWKKT